MMPAPMEPCGPIRVIVAEDEPLIAWMLEDTLLQMGLDVIGPFSCVADARSSARRDEPHLAVLDVDLADGSVYPLADELHARKIPLVFHTANVDRVDLSKRYRGSQVVLKPSTGSRLQNAVATAFVRVKT
jgi:DNA-binding response OmpR family regulator